MRDVEIGAGSSFRMTIIYSVTCSYAPMILSPLLTFGATSRDFDTTRAFTSLAFIRLLTIPLGNVQNEHATASPNATPAFSIKDGYFGWRDNNFILRQSICQFHNQNSPWLLDQ